MKKLITIIMLLGLALGAGAMAGCSKVPAGNVGVKVYLLGGEKGVDSEVLTPGRYYIGFNEELYLFPTFTQNYNWTKDSTPGSETDEALRFQTVEGMKVTADVGISYSIDQDKVSFVFQKYRKGVDEITDIFIRNMVRDALVIEGSKLKIDSVYGSGKEDLIKKVEKRVREQVDPIGIKVERIYWTGNFELPKEVDALINAKINAGQKTQQRQQEIEQTKAEAQKAIEEARGKANSQKLEAEAKAYAITAEAKAQADANKILTQSITPELTEYLKATKWDGSLPKVTGGSTPMLQMDIGK